jgi:hypothetical protein
VKQQTSTTPPAQVTLVAKVVGAAERGTYLDVAVHDGSGAIDVSIFLEQDDVSAPAGAGGGEGGGVGV